jgi:hypothetical protein
MKAPSMYNKEKGGWFLNRHKSKEEKLNFGL